MQRKHVNETYRLEGLDRILSYVVSGEVGLGIIDRETTRGASITIEIAGLDGDDGYAVVGTVRRVLEVQGGSPIVAEVLGHFTGGASSPLANIAFHGGVEGVSTYDVMNMGRRTFAWLYDGVQTLDGQCAALET